MAIADMLRRLYSSLQLKWRQKAARRKEVKKMSEKNWLQRTKVLRKQYPAYFTEELREHHASLAELHDATPQKNQDAAYTLSAASKALDKHPQHAKQLFELAHATLQKNQDTWRTLGAASRALAKHPQHAPEIFGLAHAALQRNQNAFVTLGAANVALREHSPEKIFEVAQAAFAGNLSARQAINNYVRMMKGRK